MKWPARLFFGALLLIVAGLFVRFFAITDPNFVYYDEGLYLAHNLRLLYLLEEHPPQIWTEWWKVFSACWRAALADTKTLWFFLVGLRGFFYGVDCFVFPRILSAIFGALTIPAVYVLGQRWSHSRATGVLSAVFLAMLPSHVFYSRLGLQEALSTLCFTLGFLCYLAGRRWWVRALMSGFWFGCVFFTNYRMIIIPVLLLLTEAGLWLKDRSAVDVRRCIYSSLVFATMVFGIGSLDGGANTKITFGWMFLQANSSAGSFTWLNLLSFPFYQFYLESPFWGALFVVQGIWVIRSRNRVAVLWLVVVGMMVLFSFPQEKGVRYLCCALPLLCVSSAGFINQVWIAVKAFRWRVVIGAWIVLMLAWHGQEVWRISGWTTGYARVLMDLKAAEQAQALRVSTSQPVLMSVLAGQGHFIVKPLTTLEQLVKLQSQGYQYLIIDPQAYVSYTKTGFRFEKELTPFLEFIVKAVPPEKVDPHFSPRLLERFVFEHNENLGRSWDFLKFARMRPVGQLYVYDIKKIMFTVKHFLKELSDDR